MKNLLGFACLGLLLSTPISVFADDDATSVTPKSLVGNWEFESGMRAGDEVVKERLVGVIKITETDITLPVGPDAAFVFGYKIDAEKSPASIDLEIKSGPVPEGKAVGIIKMTDGKITLCYDPTGAARPEKFESTDGNGAFLFVLKEQADE